MLLSDFIQQDLVFEALKSANKQNVIRELADLICRARHDLNTNTVTNVLLEREKLGSTGIEDGIAIPHGKISGLKNILVAFGRKKDGVAFDAHDGKPSNLFFVLLAPENSSAMHLKVLARLSRLLKNDQFRKKLLDANNPKSIYETIVHEETP
ncbi:MAG: PTS sugar transporter subunit IIA [Pseudomonadota bacterium]